MTRSFAKLCVRHQEDADSCCRFICGGEWPKPGLKLIDDMKKFEIKETEMAGKPSTGKCDLCGVGGKNLRSVKGKNCCSMCEFTWRAAHNNPDLMIEAIKEAQGETYFTDKFGGQSVQKCDCGTVREDLINAERRLHAAGEVIENTRIILGGGSKDESILEIAKRAMSCDGCDERSELQQIRSLCGIDESLPIFEKVESILGDNAAYRGKIVNIRELLSLDATDDLVGKIKSLKDQNQQCFDLFNRVQKILGADAQDDLLVEVEMVMQELTRLREMRDNVIDRGMEKIWSGRDAALLDIALDVMTGRISGLDADRIAMLR